MSTTFFLFLLMNTPPGENTAAVIPAFPLKIDSDYLPVPHATLDLFSLISATALLVLQELLTPDLFWCATEEATLRFGREGGGPSERWEGGSTKFVNAVLAFTFPPGNTLVARSDYPLHLRGKTDMTLLDIIKRQTCHKNNNSFTTSPRATYSASEVERVTYL